MKDKYEMIKWESKRAVKAGAESLEDAVTALRRATEEIERYAARYNDADKLNDKADQLNWALHYIAGNIIGNCRLDLLASRSAELMVVRQMTRDYKSGDSDEHGRD